MKIVKIALVRLIIVGGLLHLSSACLAQSPWTQKADMLNAREHHSLVELNGKIYAIGGLGYPASTTDLPPINGYDSTFTLKTMDVYDPDTDTWDTCKAEMNTKRGHFCYGTCVFNGKILAIGGSKSFYSYLLKSIEEYDPVTDTWTYKTDMPRPRNGHSISLVDGKIYIVGGGNAAEIPHAKVDVYDPLTGDWTTAADMKTPRMNHAAVVLNGKIYTIGGMGNPSPGYPALHTAEAYDPTTDTWETKADLKTERKYHAACTWNGRIYVFGGITGTIGSGGVLLSSVEVYDPVTDTWTEGTNMPTPWFGCNGIELNGKIYIIGGIVTDDLYPIPTVYVYNPRRDLLPLIEKITLDRSYAKPGIDSVLITTKMNDPTGITILAEIEVPDQTPVDSLQLFDDGNHHDGNAGDSLFANIWPVNPAEEQQYYVDLHVTRIDTGTLIHNMENLATFTTIGPLVFHSVRSRNEDDVLEPGASIRLYVTLKNNGTTATATDIETQLVCLEPSWVDISADTRPYRDIAPGQTMQNSSSYRINILEPYPGNTAIPMEIHVSSNDQMFWSDAFSIPVTVGIESEEEVEPKQFALYPNTPNPFNPSTTIRYSIPKSSEVTLTIYDLLGREIETLVNKNQTPGEYSVVWNGQVHPSGIYICRLRAGDFTETRKLVLQK
jgi:N-acetylneuraminic acid mutarotase